jgi:rhomboid protease GluP
MPQRSMSCPHCGQLIAASQSSCASCGADRPGARAGWSAASRLERNGDWLVNGIIAANVLFYLLSLVTSSSHALSGNPLAFLSPDQTSLLLLGATGSVPVVEYGRFWTLVAASYLHGGLLHIFFNMMALRQIGPWVSYEFGPSRMFIIYTLSGVSGYLASCLAGVPFTIGASASVCGLIGALFFFGKSRGGSYGVAVSREVGGWLISLVLFGLVMPWINNWAHGGGIVGGVVLGKLLGYRERCAETAVHRLLALLCMLATVVILAWAAIVPLAVWLG